MLLPPSFPSRPLPRLLAALAFCTCSAALAQRAAPQPAAPVQTTDLNEIIIAAPKISQSLLEAPLSATVTTGRTIDEAGMQTLKDAAFYAPNTYFAEFSARKLSNPRFRGVGGYPSPGVTTYYDGVPQFHANTTSLTLVDVEQVDFIRGPQAALFGRNTPGGLMNVVSRRPSLDGWHGSLETTHGNYDLHDYRGSVTGPLAPGLGFSLAGGYQSRDGYTRNTVTGNDVDGRDAWFGKMQFLWQPSDELEVRLILAGERARDGDYALNDLAQLRINPRRTARDFEGYTQRDVFMPTLQVTYHADYFDVTSITGFVWWETNDLTDLDYGVGAPAPLNAIPIVGSFLTRSNSEQQSTWTQEFRFSSPADKPIVLSEAATLSWQAGVFMFYNDYNQSIVQNRSEVVTGGLTFVTANVAGTRSDLRDIGIGTYLQSTLNLWEKLHVTGGVRWDHENKQANLRTDNFSTATGFPIPPGLAAPFNSSEDLSRSYNQVTPQAAVSYDITPDMITYFSFAGGYKAGGFNTASAAGRQVYSEERTWNYEFGLKGRALDKSLDYSLALFYTDYRNLQLNTPNPISPATYDVVNAGNAASKGIEIALNYRPVTGWDIFGSVAWQDVRFLSGSQDNNGNVLGGALTNIGGNRVPFAPDYTVAFGTQFTVEMGGGWNAYARAEIQNIGYFNYDSVNSAGQDAYTLANFRLGVRNQTWFVEAFVNNAFDTEYVPMAIPYPGIAPSGYVGESGTPLTFGVRTGVKF